MSILSLISWLARGGHSELEPDFDDELEEELLDEEDDDEDDEEPHAL